MGDKKLQPGRMMKCRILCKNEAKDEIFATNLKEYMAYDVELLTADDILSYDGIFLGMIEQCLRDG